MMLRLYIYILCAFCLPLPLLAQSERTAQGGLPPETPIELRVGKAAYKGDSIPHVIFPTLPKYPPKTDMTDRQRARYNRTVYNVKKLLPLAKLAKYTIIETYDYLETLPDKKARAEHIKLVEKGIKRQYAPVVKKLTRSQGKILIKLIDRECNQTGYNIAKAFVGAFKANLYQGIAILFGQSLNKTYDPEGEDKELERIVRQVESGVL